MGLLDRLRGIPDEPRPPAPTSRVAAGAGNAASFDLGLLPQPSRDVHAAIESGLVLAAIKAYREQSGAGLAESKHVIDAILRGDTLVSTGGVAGGATAPLGHASGASGAADASARIDQLIREGQLIAAIKVYRDQHGSGLKEAKDAVEARRDLLGRG